MKTGRPRKEVKFIVSSIGCKIVTSHKPNHDGYIRMHRDGKQEFLHRIEYEKVHGEIPEGLIIRHKCDNPSCINVEHMELGTDFENAQDKVSRGRQAKGTRYKSSKLTDDIVRSIRDDNILSNRELALKYNVGKTTISYIKNQKAWKHVV